MTQRIVVVSAGLSVPSSTKLLADKLGDAVERAVVARGREVDVQHVELRPLAHQLADHLLTGFATGELANALDLVKAADALVVVTPVFSASYSGLFKTFFDVLEPGALDGTPVVIAATAGTARHSLVLDHALRPLFAYLRAVVVPTGVFAASEDFGASDDGSLDKRVQRAAGELAVLLGGATSTAPAPARRSVADEFAAPTPFEQLLREAGGSSVR
jgi:FMN reductase